MHFKYVKSCCNNWFACGILTINEIITRKSFVSFCFLIDLLLHYAFTPHFYSVHLHFIFVSIVQTMQLPLFVSDLLLLNNAFVDRHD